MISALGENIPETWTSIYEGRSGIGPIHSVDVSELRFKNGAQIPRYNPGEHFEASRLPYLDPILPIRGQSRPARRCRVRASNLLHPCARTQPS